MNNEQDTIRSKWGKAWQCARMYMHGKEPECWQIAYREDVLDMMHDAIQRYCNANVPAYSNDILGRFRRERIDLEMRLYWESEDDTL